MLNRQPARDPRTVARDIPGIFDIIFPQLIPNIVAYFNQQSWGVPNCDEVSHAEFTSSTLQPAMLAELAAARAEQLINKNEDNWSECLNIALARQRRHFDAVLPKGNSLLEQDKKIASQIAINITNIIYHIQRLNGHQPIISMPKIPGFHWIASSVGDYAVGDSLIELKCSKRNFSTSYLRQILMYWMLSYIAQLEKSTEEFKTFFLINPRLNHVLHLRFDDVIKVTAAGQSKKEIIEDFTALIENHSPLKSSTSADSICYWI